MPDATDTWSTYWNPAIYKGTTLTYLPRPITSLRIPYEWSMRKSKIPLNDSTTTHGWSQNGIPVVIQGFIGKQAGVMKLTEQAMFGVFTSLVTVLDVGASSDKFEFFFYYDAGTATYRKLKNCVPVSFECDIGDQDRQLFPYTIRLQSEDPAIYSTAPGA